MLKSFKHSACFGNNSFHTRSENCAGVDNQRIKNADKIYREQKFTIAVPLGELNSDVPKEFSSEKAVVQGVIDCAFFENGETIVLDYKTDNVKDEEELKRRYSGQLSIYKRAAEEIFSQPVKETLIFSLRLNKTVVLDI